VKPRRGRRVVRMTLVALVGLVVCASPAAADPAKPGDYRSIVTSVEPPTNAVQVKVVGGDGFLDVKVQRGHDVTVLGYDGEPWLHITPDGTVLENQNSPATYLNVNRYARVTVPPNVDPKAAPDFTRIATGGEYTWHDHRIHWMSPDHPPNHRAGDVIFPDWQVQLTVDGTPTVAHGRLTWVKDVNPLPYLAVIAVLAALLVVFAGKKVWLASAAVLVVAVLALYTGWRAWASIPSAGGPNPLELWLPGVGVAAAALAVAFVRKAWSVIFTLAAVSALAAWCIERNAVLFNPVLPTRLSFGVDRTVTAAALGICIGAAVVAVRAGVVFPKLPALDFGDDEDGDSDA